MATQKGMLSFRLPSRRDIDDNAALAAERAALHAVSIITRRTGKGLDVDGRPFKPYGAAYAAKRAAAGRQTSPVNLTLTGTLLRGLRVLRVEPNGRRAWIGWEGQHVTRPVLTGFGAGRFRQIAQGRVSRLDQTPLTPAQSAFVKKAGQQARAAKGLQTVSYLDLVGGIERKRAFFAIRSRKERAEIVEVYRRTVRDGLQRRLNARRP